MFNVYIDGEATSLSLILCIRTLSTRYVACPGSWGHHRLVWVAVPELPIGGTLSEPTRISSRSKFYLRPIVT